MEQIESARDRLSFLNLLINNQTRMIQDLRNRRGVGRPRTELSDQIRVEDQRLQEMQSVYENALILFNSINRLIILNNQQPSNFFIQRIELKQNNFDSLIAQFVANPEWATLNPTIDNDTNFDNLNSNSDIQTQSLEELYLSTFSASLQENINLSTNFEQIQKELTLNHCFICEEISLNILEDNICNRCRKYPNLPPDDLNNIQNNLNPFSAFNFMIPGPQPEQLKNLTLMEQILISPIKPFITLFRLRGCQFGYSGNIINFQQDLSNLNYQLPHSLNSLSDFVIIRKETDDVRNFREFRVRRRKVHEALEHLMLINNRYRNAVVVDHDALTTLPENDSVHTYFRECFESNENEEQNLESQEFSQNQTDLSLITETNVPNIEIPIERERVDDALNATPVIQMPELDNRPINELTEGLVCLAFPCLFPTGIY